MLPIVGVSLEEALLGFGSDDDTELHDKEVSFTTSDVTGSQTAIFEYDPQDEPVAGTPPGPWDGYSLFTIDLSAVKTDIEAMQAQIAALEDELEEMQECCDEVLDVIHDYDPTYDPHPDPPDPTNPTIPEKIQEIIDEESGYTLPDGTDPSDPNVQAIINGNPVTDNNTGATLGFQTYMEPDGHWSAGVYVIVDGVKTDYWYVSGGTAVPVDHFSDMKVWVTDPTTGDWSASVTVHWGIAWSPTVYTGSGRDARLIGYGSTSDTYTVKNS